MIGVRGFRLRTQLAVVVAAFVLFALGAGLSGWLHSRAQSWLAQALHADLAIATRLPKLKVLLRSLDLATAQYLKSGDPAWLDEHERILGKLRDAQRELAGLFPGERERDILRKLERHLDEHFVRENTWFRERSAGPMDPARIALLLSSRRNYEEILEIVLGMHEVDLQEFPGRVRDAEAQSRRGLMAIVSFGLASSALLAWILGQFVIAPIHSLSDYAGRWKPGQPWDCEAPSVSPEINDLFRVMKGLMEDLNREYRKEMDMGLLKSQLVSLVSHELNNSLSVIHAAAASLEDSEAEPRDPRREKMHRIIKGQTLNLSRAVGNLLNMGRLESGKLSLAKEKMDIPASIRTTLELMEPLYQNKNLHVTLTAPHLPVPVFADPDALSLVLTNLLSNAIKYTPDGGAIHVGCDRSAESPGQVRVYIQDTGIGIGPEDKQRIFAGHYRSEHGKRLAKGFGIGLFLTRSIVEAHGGKLEVESEPGKGSTFSFLLPAWLERPEDAGGRLERPSLREATK